MPVPNQNGSSVHGSHLTRGISTHRARNEERALLTSYYDEFRCSTISNAWWNPAWSCVPFSEASFTLSLIISGSFLVQFNYAWHKRVLKPHILCFPVAGLQPAGGSTSLHWDGCGQGAAAWLLPSMQGVRKELHAVFGTGHHWHGCHRDSAGTRKWNDRKVSDASGIVL